MATGMIIAMNEDAEKGQLSYCFSEIIVLKKMRLLLWSTELLLTQAHYQTSLILSRWTHKSARRARGERTY